MMKTVLAAVACLLLCGRATAQTDPWARPDGYKTVPKAPPVTVDDRVAALETTQGRLAARLDAIEARLGVKGQAAPAQAQTAVTYPYLPYGAVAAAPSYPGQFYPVYGSITPYMASYGQETVCGPNGCYTVQQYQPPTGIFRRWR
jgi:hypothetical protein